MVKVGRARGGQLTNGYFEVDRGEHTIRGWGGGGGRFQRVVSNFWYLQSI